MRGTQIPPAEWIRSPIGISLASTGEVPIDSFWFVLHVLALRQILFNDPVLEPSKCSTLTTFRNALCLGLFDLFRREPKKLQSLGFVCKHLRWDLPWQLKVHYQTWPR